MNTDCTKPSVAPKPRFVCHASLKLPSPLMSAARGPKPSIAPKPKVTPELNGYQGGCIHSSSLNSNGQVDEERDTETGLNKVAAGRLERDVEGAEDGDAKEEDDMIQNMDEDWKLTDNTQTEEADSLEILWVSDGGLTADSEDMVETVDTDVTEDMDADGCDAGEALADTDGISVGDVSVNSVDVEAGGCSAENPNMRRRQENVQIKEDEAGDCTADDLTESLTDEPGLLSNENIGDANTQPVFLTDGEDKEEESPPDCSITCNILKFKGGHKMKEKGENLQNVNFYDLIPEDRVCDTFLRHVAVEDEPAREPYYVSSEDIVNKDMMPRNNKAHGLPQSPLLLVNSSGVSAGNYEEKAENGQTEFGSSENCVELGNSLDYSNYDRDENKVRTYQKRTQESKAKTLEALLDHVDCQPRLRLVSISVPTDTDTSPTSSFSESQLLSPSDSDVFDEDLDGHIVPFLEDTTDTEQDISDEHVYEDPGQS